MTSAVYYLQLLPEELRKIVSECVWVSNAPLELAAARLALSAHRRSLISLQDNYNQEAGNLTAIRLFKYKATAKKFISAIDQDMVMVGHLEPKLQKIRDWVIKPE